MGTDEVYRRAAGLAGMAPIYRQSWEALRVSPPHSQSMRVSVL
jgi:hypothetical protein